MGVGVDSGCPAVQRFPVAVHLLLLLLLPAKAK